MSTYPQFSKIRLALLGSISFLLLIPSTLVWLVNLDVALRIHYPTWQGVQSWLPAVGYGGLLDYCDDLSTISTFIPMMLCLFPLVLAWRVFRWGSDAPERLLHEVYDPYPPHFPFFLVMLGLAGTLYGLLIGLDVSGVSTLGGEGMSPEKIQQTLDQLLGGTATALLSSLVGLAGAFLSARPLTWLCHRAVSMPTDAEAVSLEETFRDLIQDMEALGKASQHFREQLGGSSLQDLPEALEQIQQDLRLLREHSENRSFETALLDVLKSMQQQQQEQSNFLRGLSEQLLALGTNQEALHSQSIEQRAQMLEHLKQQHVDRDTDRSALRNAFGEFLGNTKGEDAQ